MGRMKSFKTIEEQIDILRDKGLTISNDDKTKDISRQLIERCYQGFSPEERQTTFALLKRIFNNFKN